MIIRQDITGFTAHRIREEVAAVAGNLYVLDKPQAFGLAITVGSDGAILSAYDQADEDCTALVREVCAPLFRSSFVGKSDHVEFTTADGTRYSFNADEVARYDDELGYEFMFFHRLAHPTIVTVTAAIQNTKER